MRSLRTRALGSLLPLLTVAGCATPGADDAPLTYEEAPVSDLAPLVDGLPDPSTLPDESKADQAYPARFDLMDIQTPVRSQGSRGTCSIFSTTALMESLYRAEGTIREPDFSEQFLQWSVKNELRRGTSEGSNAGNNLDAIARFGIVEEPLWQYQERSWSEVDDPACVGESRPLRCWTNGEPPAAAREGRRFQLPHGRSIRPTRRSIQGHMVTKRTPVVVGGPFYYQAWNHGGSMLPTNADYRRRGIVLSPNAADIADSEKRPAGHSFLLVGWDSDMEVQQLDEQGAPRVDRDGRPMMERGFFLFKNSWGTARFGLEGTPAPGYGWISMRYVERYLSAYVSDLPRVQVPPEACNNDVDDDRDGDADCEDTQCAVDRACMDADTTLDLEATPNALIPDATETGVGSEIVIAEGGAISSLAIDVEVTHPYRGDLVIRLEHDGRVVTLLDRSGGPDDDVRQTFGAADWNGADASGTWRLVVADTATADTGTFVRWGLRITRCTGGDCAGAEQSRRYASEPALPIPDALPSGAHDDIQITDPGNIVRLSVGVVIDHPYPYDLTLRLARVGGSEVVLLQQPADDGPSLVRTFDVARFVGEPLAGTWRLTVVDDAGGDVGRLERWSIDAATR
jgi:subtilisin-like proprotein convertase family protein